MNGPATDLNKSWTCQPCTLMLQRVHFSSAMWMGLNLHL